MLKFLPPLMLAMLFCLATATPIKANPLDLPWGVKVEKHFQEIKDFQYFYGDVEWGQMIFLGQFDELEAEIQLDFTSRYIVKAFLILGPGGVNQSNCFSKYKNIINLMNKKYGHFYFKKFKEDPTLEELLYTSKCRPFALGMRELTTYWKIPNFSISAALWGDGEELFIEIEYVYTPMLKKFNQEKTQRLLNKL